MMKDASTARDLELQAEGAASFPAPEEVRASHTSRVKPDEATKAKKGRSLVLVSWVVLVVLAIAVPSIIIGRKSTSSHVGVVSKYFVDQGVSESSAFDDESSPQYLAALWLASQDGATLPLPSDTRGVREYLFRYVMALNYFAFDGDKWFAPLKFLSNEPVCKWKSLDFGVLCYEVDGEELPLELVLTSNNLRGSIPTENGKLSTLRRLDFSNGTVMGTIPEELCALPNLSYLVLNHNALRGTIPSCLSRSTNLVDLWLSNNMMTGTLPIELEKLSSSLEELYVDDNRLTGNPIPVLSKLTTLTHIMAARNDFEGTIDSSSFAQLENLHWMDISHNGFKSTAGFPAHLFDLPLNVLDVSSNKLVGSFPASIVENSNLAFLSLHDNLLDGPVSSLSMLKGLIHCDLSSNRLTGSMDVFASLPKLALAFLSNNPFAEGPVPDGFEKLVNLTELSLRNTNRNGLLPVLAKKLRLLDLGGNAMTGAVPASYGRHTRLQYMLLNNNTGIMGEIPSTFARMTSLRGAFLDGTSLENNTMEIMCQMRPFAAVRDIYDEVLIGDCETCPCGGCQCCDPGLEEGCSRPLLDNLDATWETDFRRVSYDLKNFTADLESKIRPHK